MLNVRFFSYRRFVFFLSILLNASCCATVGALGLTNAPFGAVISIGWLVLRCNIIGVWTNLLLLLLLQLLLLVLLLLMLLTLLFVCEFECAIFTSTLAGIKFPNGFFMLTGDFALKLDF